MNKGKIILLNGASSAGKSSIAMQIQQLMDEPFWRISSDQLIEAKVLPLRDFEGGRFAWKSMRPRFFAGFHNSLPALANAGNNLIVDHVIECEEWLKELAMLLAEFDVFFVGVHCDLDELQVRELKRGDRTIGEAKYHYERVHAFCTYDFEIDSTNIMPVKNAETIIDAWGERKLSQLR